jgi:hypothetical protein
MGFSGISVSVVPLEFSGNFDPEKDIELCHTKCLASLLSPAAKTGCTRDDTQAALLCLWQNRSAFVACAQRHERVCFWLARATALHQRFFVCGETAPASLPALTANIRLLT